MLKDINGGRMTEKIKKWINGIRWKYFTNLKAGYTQQAVYDELNMYNAIIEENKLGEWKND